MILTKLSHAWNLTFLFLSKVWPYPIQEDIFIEDSYVNVKSVFLNLTKFWQHFALISKYTTWKQWHEFHHSQVCTQITKWNALYQNFINFKKRDLIYTYESTIKNAYSQTVQMDNSRFNTMINLNCQEESLYWISNRKLRFTHNKHNLYIKQ